jgi:hypothetical protein
MPHQSNAGGESHLIVPPDTTDRLSHKKSRETYDSEADFRAPYL